MQWHRESVEGTLWTAILRGGKMEVITTKWKA